MHTILIAGAGQLGSRHLQGVKTSKNELDIWVYDLSEESLKVAEERYNQVESDNKTAHFVTSLDRVPSDLDVVIVASSSKPRYAIITQLLSDHNVKYMVLEKFLFPKLSDYSEIADLIKEKNVKTWVNCPRRMFESWEHLRDLMDTSLPVEMDYKGGEWGMCCNTIHFVDIFMYLNNQSSYTFNLEKIVPEVVDSKRPGYVELMGTEEFVTPNGSKLVLSSEPDFVGSCCVKIKNGKTFIEFYEGKGECIINGETLSFPIHFQSGLSGILVDEILKEGDCKLTPYNISASYHITYLSKIAPFINKLKGWTSDSCPIT